MYCPKCATDNLDAARYCRTCGTDISLVSQALTGQLPLAQASEDEEELDSKGRRKKRRHRTPRTMEGSIKNIFIGLGFLFLALALSRTAIGMLWWYWMLLPAFTTLGGGVAGLMRARKEEQQRRALPLQRPVAAAVTTSLSPARPGALPPRDTSEILQPPSITEGTTRHLGAEAPTQHIGGEPARKSFND
jgi:hypothetical protein